MSGLLPAAPAGETGSFGSPARRGTEAPVAVPSGGHAGFARASSE